MIRAGRVVRLRTDPAQAGRDCAAHSARPEERAGKTDCIMILPGSYGAPVKGKRSTDANVSGNAQCCGMAIRIRIHLPGSAPAEISRVSILGMCKHVTGTNVLIAHVLDLHIMCGRKALGRACVAPDMMYKS